jgi:hypothetical protein
MTWRPSIARAGRQPHAHRLRRQPHRRRAARTARVEIGFLAYSRVGVLLAVVTLLIGSLVLILVPV